MSEENNKQHQDDEQKEVSSSQATTTTTDDQTTATPKVEQKPKVFVALPSSDAKPATSDSFKLFSFSGDHSEARIMNWIRVYENMADRSGWTDDQKKWNLPSYLEADAFDYYVEHVLSKKLDWTQARQQLVQRFDQYELEAFMEFLSHKWAPRMELKEYFKTMRGLGMAAGLKDEEIIAGLNRGLPPNLRSELDFVTSLQQWVAVAFCLQQRLEDSSNPSYKPWKGGRRGGRGNNSRGNPNGKPRNNMQMPGDHHHQANNSHQSIDITDA